MKPERIIISGGGTGGHIFPALSIANAFRERFPEIEILFVGADNRMEMERIPAAGYPIKGLPIMGFDRRRPWRNFKVIARLVRSLRMARRILGEFKPDFVVGVGGYASGPLLWAASALKIPVFIQEQNSYAGITNKLLGKKAAGIFVSYEGMEKFFPSGKIILAGNPVRKDLEAAAGKRSEACAFFGLSPDRTTLLAVGGSLGASTINRSIGAGLEYLRKADIQLIWQTGRNYIDEARRIVEQQGASSYVWVSDFISRMDYAYTAASLVISRAGAGTISELCLLGKPAILIPSPNVAEDHQTKNAMALVVRGAAIFIADKEAEHLLIPMAITQTKDAASLAKLGQKIRAMARPRSDRLIVESILTMLGEAFYFVGAGGIGMSAILRYYLSKGKAVGGYDKTPSSLTEQLIGEGALIHYDDNANLIPEAFRSPQTTTVIYTPAVPDSHGELNWFRSRNFTIMKRSEALGAITRASRALCVAGTHGKTTTSSMIAHLLKQSPVDCSAFLGGILKNYGTNLLLSDKSDLTVVEADEYDRSFLHLQPWMAIITSADPDHLDIYGTPEAYRQAFEQFTSLIRPGGCLIMKQGVDISPRLQDDVRLYTYSIGEESDFGADNIRVGGGEIIFDAILPDDGRISDIHLGVPVRINIENAIAAIAVARLNGAGDEDIRQAMASFRGSERRFDFHIKRDDLVLIDDYAHHPAELQASISSVRELYAGRKITGIFQPHLYSRTRDFADDFAAALSLLDELILLDIYPAREEPIPGVSSLIIFDKVAIPNKVLCTKEQLLKEMADRTNDIVIMLGAGDIDRLVEPLKHLLLNGK
ncbi:MAG: UDP-N-acetylmuramate--L-alanine ligase [Tannerellaceae bacterium]|jgi:UDP-N-acetylmuramate--alanine ligase|nr:UDP-N-acetylmuramate--L-alanine ligase [Tannerellaceae bacterium]